MKKKCGKYSCNWFLRRLSWNLPLQASRNDAVLSIIFNFTNHGVLHVSSVTLRSIDIMCRKICTILALGCWMYFGNFFTKWLNQFWSDGQGRCWERKHSHLSWNKYTMMMRIPNIYVLGLLARFELGLLLAFLVSKLKGLRIVAAFYFVFEILRNDFIKTLKKQLTNWHVQMCSVLFLELNSFQ